MKYQLVFKRIFDFFVSIISLILLLPLFFVIAVLVKIDSRGSIFFRFERVGRNGKSFKPFKFRTMGKKAIETGLGYTVSKDDSRITKMGKFLRRSGLDELPQLINVIKGEMSLVGPRPTFSYQVEKYSDFQRKRLLARPGITNLVLIKGRNLLSWEERIKYDVWYIEHWSFWLDVKILFITPFVVLSGKGVYGEKGVNDPF
jgi:lipopolysaccharide/colanic/teichoic acid biosynthesis glycosyltransferase